MTVFNSPRLSSSLLFLILFASINFQTTYSQNPIILQVCAQTNFNEICVSMLSSHSRSSQISIPYDVGDITLDLTRGLAIRALDKLKSMLSLIEDHDVRQKLEKCKEKYHFIYGNSAIAWQKWTSKEPERDVPYYARKFLGLNDAAMKECSNEVGDRFQPLFNMNVEMDRLTHILRIICNMISGSTSSSSGHNPVIQQICERTEFEEECITMLSKHAHSSQAHNLYDVGKITLDLTIRNAQRAIHWLTGKIAGIQHNHDLEENLEKMEKCKDEYNVIYHNSYQAKQSWSATEPNALNVALDIATSNMNAVMSCTNEEVEHGFYRALRKMNTDAYRLSIILRTVCLQKSQ